MQTRAEAAAKRGRRRSGGARQRGGVDGAAADGALTGATFVLAGHGTTSKKALRGAALPPFVGCEGLYADADALARLLREQGAVVYDLAIEPRSSAIFKKNGSIRCVLIRRDHGPLGRPMIDRPQPASWLDFKPKAGWSGVVRPARRS